MIRHEVNIQNKLGLHARAASKFVSVAGEFESDVNVISPFATANGKSIMKVMLLQASIGTKLMLEIDGNDEKEALEALVELINNKFDEAE